MYLLVACGIATPTVDLSASEAVLLVELAFSTNASLPMVSP